MQPGRRSKEDFSYLSKHTSTLTYSMSQEQARIEQLENEVLRLKEQVAQTAVFQQEKKRFEDEYQHSQKRFRTIFEQSVIGKKIIDDQLQIVKINKALLDILGYREEEILGGRITDFSHPDFLQHWKNLQKELWTTDMPSFSFDTCLIKKDGSTAWVSITSILIEDQGKTLGYTIAEDIWERKEMEKLQRLINEQEQRQQIAETVLNTQE